MGWVMAPARQLRGHQFGNAVLSRFPSPIMRSTTCPGRRARAQLQRVDIASTPHAPRLQRAPGTALLERRHQAERLAAIVYDRHVAGPKLVLGDFNEWMRGPRPNY